MRPVVVLLATAVLLGIAAAGRRGGGRAKLRTSGSFIISAGNRAGGGEELGELDGSSDFEYAAGHVNSASFSTARGETKQPRNGAPLDRAARNEALTRTKKSITAYFSGHAVQALGEASEENSHFVQPGMVISLQAHNGKFCSARPNDRSICSSDTVGETEKFTVVGDDQGRLALVNGDSVPAAQCISDANKLEVVDVGKNSIALKIAGTYCALGGGPVGSSIDCTKESTVTPQATFVVACVEQCSRSPAAPAVNSSVPSQTQSSGSKLPPVEKPPQHTPQFYKGDEGDGCKAGDLIQSKADCVAAHEALGLNKKSEWVGNYPGVPRGCSFDGKELHWNAHPTGSPRGDIIPICISSSPAPAPTIPLNSQTAGCWAPASHASSEDYTVYIDATSTEAARVHAQQNNIQDGAPWISAVTGACAACVKPSLLVGGKQTRFDCTDCPSGSTLVVTNIARQSGWCNAYHGSCSHSSSTEQCETCVKAIHPFAKQLGHVHCTTCSRGTVDKAVSWQEKGKLADGTLIHPATLGTGECHTDASKREIGYHVTTGTGIYDYGAPWCAPSGDWDVPKLICTKLSTVAMRIALVTAKGSEELYLVECEIKKMMHRYKCYNNATKCRSGEVGPLCDDTGTSCGEGLYRGESAKEVKCVGFYTEVRGNLGKRGTSLGCDNIPETAVAHLGCTAGDNECAQAAACSRIAAIE